METRGKNVKEEEEEEGGEEEQEKEEDSGSSEEDGDVEDDESDYDPWSPLCQKVSGRSQRTLHERSPTVPR